jgi:hypothetical protein
MLIGLVIFEGVELEILFTGSMLSKHTDINFLIHLGFDLTCNSNSFVMQPFQNVAAINTYSIRFRAQSFCSALKILNRKIFHK